MTSRPQEAGAIERMASCAIRARASGLVIRSTVPANLVNQGSNSGKQRLFPDVLQFFASTSAGFGVHDDRDAHVSMDTWASSTR